MDTWNESIRAHVRSNELATLCRCVRASDHEWDAEALGEYVLNMCVPKADDLSDPCRQARLVFWSTITDFFSFVRRKRSDWEARMRENHQDIVPLNLFYESVDRVSILHEHIARNSGPMRLIEVMLRCSHFTVQEAIILQWIHDVPIEFVCTALQTRQHGDEWSFVLDRFHLLRQFHLQSLIRSIEPKDFQGFVRRLFALTVTVYTFQATRRECERRSIEQLVAGDQSDRLRALMVKLGRLTVRGEQVSAESIATS